MMANPEWTEPEDWEDRAHIPDAVAAALMAVVGAVRDYLPPDGIDAQECLNRVILATDNADINPFIKSLEGGA